MAPVRPRFAVAAPAALAALAALALAGCTSSVPVFELPPITDCEAARLGVDGDRCDLFDRCLWSDPAPGGCCTTRATCEQSVLSIDTGCGTECGLCGPDRDCPFGEAFCQGDRCTPCPETAPCPPCPAGWVPLERNGCPSCECAPPSQCDVLSPATCLPPDRCYIGALCAEGCESFDCCVNVCSNAECIPIAFEGCPTACSTISGCSECALEQCECMPGGTWVCRERCITPGSVRECKFFRPGDVIVVP